MGEPKITDKIYRSGTHPIEKGWDVLQVIFQYGDERPDEFLTLARTLDGTILKRTSPGPEEWVIVTDEEQLRFSQEQFDMRDRLSLEQVAEHKNKTSA
jgi:hypothetical protein